MTICLNCGSVFREDEPGRIEVKSCIDCEEEKELRLERQERHLRGTTSNPFPDDETYESYYSDRL